MKELIANLKVLNQIDVQLRMIKKDMERLPKELSEKQVPIRSLRAAMDRSNAEITRLKIEADVFELEVKSGEEGLKRYAGQMNVLRTSKEFETVRRQMDAQRAWNKENENKALGLLEQVDALQQANEKNSAALAAAEEALAVETARIEKEMTELKAKYDSLYIEREKLAKDVPDKELVIYNRIVATHGTAISVVDRGNCSGCFMKIPPQTHNLAILAKDIVCCPSCGRILTTL